jgi:hypothetical protein
MDPWLAGWLAGWLGADVGKVERLDPKYADIATALAAAKHTLAGEVAIGYFSQTTNPHVFLLLQKAATNPQCWWNS